MWQGNLNDVTATSNCDEIIQPFKSRRIILRECIEAGSAGPSGNLNFAGILRTAGSNYADFARINLSKQLKSLNQRNSVPLTFKEEYAVGSCRVTDHESGNGAAEGIADWFISPTPLAVIVTLRRTAMSTVNVAVFILNRERDAAGLEFLDIDRPDQATVA